MTSIARAVSLAGTAPVRATRLQRVLLALSAVLLGVSVLFPLWKVSLTAPQYPEGLGMHIWAHTVSGIEPNDLQNINGLNHYIGMATIEPDEIEELEYMRPGMIGMALLGLGLAAMGRRRLMVLWSAALALAAVAGMADFYKWEYEYGHNLDYEHAPIKIPGMAYQPPLIGSKQLLNFTATSLPATGGVLAIASVSIAVVVAVSVLRTSRRSKA